jgi:hypothetical protein
MDSARLGIEEPGETARSCAAYVPQNSVPSSAGSRCSIIMQGSFSSRIASVVSTGSLTSTFVRVKMDVKESMLLMDDATVSSSRGCAKVDFLELLNNRRNIIMAIAVIVGYCAIVVSILRFLVVHFTKFG